MVANESVLFSRQNAIREKPMHQNGGINALDYSLSVGRKGNQHHPWHALLMHIAYIFKFVILEKAPTWIFLLPYILL